MFFWQLADLGDAVGARYSDLVDMRADGFTPQERLEFDFAVRSVKRWADQRAAMTTQKSAPPAPSTPQMTVPLFATLQEVLALPTEAEENMRRIGLTYGDIEELGEALLEEMGRYAGED